MTETRQAFLARVDGNDSLPEQALFIAIAHLELIADGGIPHPHRLAEQCLESIDKRLGGEG